MTRQQSHKVSGPVIVKLRRAAASARHREEVLAFTRFCLARLERELGALERCTVSVDRASEGIEVAVVRTYEHDTYVEACGIGRDAARAIWEAMCRIEQPLRELRRAA